MTIDHPTHITQRASGCLFGLALGDALAAPTEFLSVAQILHTYPPAGPQQLAGNPALVTDDTQMMLAVGEALLQAPQPFRADSLEGPLRTAFVEWLRSPDNNRAPGISCLRACEKLAVGLPWYDATTISSKGCGANMRVAPVGLLPAGTGKEGVSQAERGAIAQFQAALTHGHATALAASDLTSRTIAYLVAGGTLADLLEFLREYVSEQKRVYHSEWLGSLWQRPGVSSPEEFIEQGWEECLGVLNRLETALAPAQIQANRKLDPCLLTGAGWIAEEAFATGLLCFLLFPDDPVAALRRAALSSGDSDSIACLSGAFAGAYHGRAAWPTEWLERIEYKSRIEALAAKWD